MLKLTTNLCLIVSVMLLMGCDKVTRINACYAPVPFKFHDPTITWLKQCEVVIPPPMQAIVDFDTFSKKYKKDKEYYDSVGR